MSSPDVASSVEGSYYPPSSSLCITSGEGEGPPQSQHQESIAVSGSAQCSTISSSEVATDPLTEYRLLHQNKYKQRLQEEAFEEVERQKNDQENADAQMALRLQNDEQRYLETRFAADQEYTRQLHEQLNAAVVPVESSFLGGTVAAAPETFEDYDEE